MSEVVFQMTINDITRTLTGTEIVNMCGRIADRTMSSSDIDLIKAAVDSLCLNTSRVQQPISRDAIHVESTSLREAHDRIRDLVFRIAALEKQVSDNHEIFRNHKVANGEWIQRVSGEHRKRLCDIENKLLTPVRRDDDVEQINKHLSAIDAELSTPHKNCETLTKKYCHKCVAYTWHDNRTPSSCEQCQLARVTAELEHKSNPKSKNSPIGESVNDDSEPITEGWLLSVGFAVRTNCQHLRLYVLGKACIEDYRGVRYQTQIGDKCEDIKTRRDVRILCELLRIELKEDK